MSAALIAVVVSLLLGHFVPSLPALRRYDWFIGWLHWLGRQTGADWPGRVGLLVAVGLPLLAVGAAQFLLDDLLYGLPAFGFALLALLYTWGPRDLNLDVEAVIEAREPEARRCAGPAGPAAGRKALRAAARTTRRRRTGPGSSRPRAIPGTVQRHAAPRALRGCRGNAHGRRHPPPARGRWPSGPAGHPGSGAAARPGPGPGRGRRSREAWRPSRGAQAEKLLPQPQVVLALGLRMTNCAPCRLSR
jgi:hypothetical protein